MNIFICQNISRFLLGRINLDIHLWYFDLAEYIRIFICPLSMVTNIIRYLFVQINDICPTLLLSAPFLTPAETKILVLLFASVERFSVSRMWDFFLSFTKTLLNRVSKTCGRAVVQPRKILLTLRKILRFACAN